jgi:collagen type VII alpha
MKKSVITNPIKFIIKKRVILINSVMFAAILTILAAGCIKEDYPVRLVYPVLTTASATTVTTTSAVTGGEITFDGGKAVTARGVCFGSSINPSTAIVDSMTVDGEGDGVFVSNLSGLVPNKTYHVRAYATNPDGTAYGQDITFTTAAK